MPRENKAAPATPKKKAKVAKPKKKASKAKANKSKRTNKGLNKWGLTPKQEKFCQEYIANGGDASAAYRIAYNPTDPQAEWIWEEASRVRNHPEVSQRILELQEKISEQFITGQVMQKQILLRVITKGLESNTVVIDSETVKTGIANNLSAVVSATDKLIRMEGNYPKDKIELSGSLAPITSITRTIIDPKNES